MAVPIVVTAQEELIDEQAFAALPERHRLWLAEEVPDLITVREARVFLTLTTERHRNAFVDAFWRRRDPNPWTPENEFRIERYARSRQGEHRR